MKFQFLLFIYLFNPFPGFCQWQNLGGGLDGAGYDMLYDTSTNLLYTVGYFNHADGILVNGIAVWDGLHWDSLGNGSPYGAPAYSLTKYQGKIYASAIFYYTFPNNYNCLAWWNGQYWDTLNTSVNEAIYVFKEYNNELYFGGTFKKIGTSNANLIAKFDGNNFTTFPFSGDYSVRAIEFFQGDMYVGGNFYDTISGINDLERWDGNSFQPFGGNGLAFGSDAVSSMVIYNNELYIAGGFWVSTGSPANNIMRWDGNQFHDVGGGLNGGVRKMHIFNGELYVSGDFTMAGSVPINNYIAKWNGSQWSEVFHNSLNNIITDFIVINNDLYITGGFTLIDTIPINHIAKYAGLISVNEIDLSHQINIFPNPSKDKLQINSGKITIQKIIVRDLLGKDIYSENNNSTSYQLDVSFLTSGLYFLVLETKEGTVVKKFIKE